MHYNEIIVGYIMSGFSEITLGQRQFDRDDEVIQENDEVRGRLAPLDNAYHSPVNGEAEFVNDFVPPHGTVIVPNAMAKAVIDPKDFFAVREGAIERATKDCNPVILDQLDGKHNMTWLLTEISYWDSEKERLVFLCDNSLIILKYDFIGLRLLEYRRLYLKNFDKVSIGMLTYPQKSVMASRNQQGVRCCWMETLPPLKAWNPFNEEVPYVTFASHPLAAREGAPATYNVGHFGHLLAQAVDKLDLTKAPPADKVRLGRCKVVHENITIESYAGIVSAFHNLADLGFYKNRGKFSF